MSGVGRVQARSELRQKSNIPNPFMLTETEARQRILSAITPGPVQELGLLAALGRFAAREVIASVPIPGFDNSMMDGYALHAADSAGPGKLIVSAEQPAGMNLGQHCEPGHTIRIFTDACWCRCCHHAGGCGP
jgi:molybdopterin molybdotransferase